jgi:hypothetical protein
LREAATLKSRGERQMKPMERQVDSTEAGEAKTFRKERVSAMKSKICQKIPTKRSLAHNPVLRIHKRFREFLQN